MVKMTQVLLVEDEADHAELIRRAFQARAEHVGLSVASNLAQARSHLDRSTPDLVITDLVLPDGRGVELLGGGRDEPGYPVVIMTSQGDERAAVEAMKAGALDCVIKSEATLADMPHIAERAIREWAYLAERNQLASQLLEHQERLRALASELALAEQRERRRIATGLHDSVAQNLTVSKIRLQSLRRRLGQSGELAELDEVIDLVDRSVEEIRLLAFQLSPPILVEAGLPAAAEWLAERFGREHNLPCEFQQHGHTTPLGEDLRVTLFHALRELLANVVKHARATQVHVVLKEAQGRTHLSVADNGVGFDPSEIDSSPTVSVGFGLLNIRERLGFFGGRMDIRSVFGKGTTVELTVPLFGEQGTGE